MLKSGNGDPKKCIENLVSIVRGEIPFDRVRGMDGRLIDKPGEETRLDMEIDVKWNVETYEPRVNPANVATSFNAATRGEYDIDVQISKVNENE